MATKTFTVHSIFESNQILLVISEFLPVRDISSMECVSKGIFDTYRSIPDFWMQQGLNAPYFANKELIKRFPTGKIAVQAIDRVYQRILVSDDVVWLVSRLNLHPMCTGILNKTFTRLAKLVEGSMKSLGAEVTPEMLFDVYRTNCLSETANILNSSMESQSTIISGLRLVVVLTRPVPNWEHTDASGLISFRTKVINSSNLAKCVVNIASARPMNGDVLFLVLQSFQNLSLFPKQLATLLACDALGLIRNVLYHDTVDLVRRDITKAGLQAYLNIFDPVNVPDDEIQNVISICISTYDRHQGDMDIADNSLRLLKFVAVWHVEYLQNQSIVSQFVQRIYKEFNDSTQNRHETSYPSYAASMDESLRVFSRLFPELQIDIDRVYALSGIQTENASSKRSNSSSSSSSSSSSNSNS